MLQESGWADLLAMVTRLQSHMLAARFRGKPPTEAFCGQSAIVYLCHSLILPAAARQVAARSLRELLA